MPKLVISLWSLVFGLFVLSPFPVMAQPAATASGKTTCDLCGWCNSAIYPDPPPNWDQCRACLYNPDGSEKGNSFYTVFGCISTATNEGLPQTLVKSLLSIVFGISGGLAFLMFLHGAVKILTSTGDPEKLRAGKDTVTSSIVGVLLIIFSIFLLRLIGFEILKIPGFG